MSEKGRLTELDYLRGYGVLAVIMLHAELSMPALHKLGAPLFNQADFECGVDIFFVISGFVIAGVLTPLWQGTADLRPALEYSLTFYCKRFLRLWPAAAVWLVYNFLASIVLRHGIEFPEPMDCLRKLILGLVYLYNFQEYSAPTALGYFWSLSVEWQFYLLFPLLLIGIRHNLYRAVFLVVLMVVLACAQFGGGIWWMFRCDGLIMGILLFMVVDQLQVSLPTLPGAHKRGFAAAFTFILLLAIFFAGGSILPHRLGMWFASALSTVLVAAGAVNRGYVSTFGMPKLVAWAGSRSYSLYLVHLPCILTYFAVNRAWCGGALGRWPVPLNLLIILAAIGGSAEATYRLVELPSHVASRAFGRLSQDPSGRCA